MKIIKYVISFSYLLFAIAFVYITYYTVLFGSSSIGLNGKIYVKLSNITYMGLCIGIPAILVLAFAGVNLYFVFKDYIFKKANIILLNWLFINSIIIKLIPPQIYAISQYMIMRRLLLKPYLRVLPLILSYIPVFITAALFGLLIYEIVRKRNENS